MTDHTREVFETAKATFSRSIIGLKDLHWERLPPTVLDYLRANPGISAFQLVCLLVTALPGLVAMPAVFGLGFGSSGPMAGGWLQWQVEDIATDMAVQAGSLPLFNPRTAHHLCSLLCKVLEWADGEHQSLMALSSRVRFSLELWPSRSGGETSIRSYEHYRWRVQSKAKQFILFRVIYIISWL